MKTAKLFTNGSSQAVRLPKECRFDETEKEVCIRKVGNMVLLFPKSDPWHFFLEGPGFTDDVFESIEDARRADAEYPLRDIEL